MSLLKKGEAKKPLRTTGRGAGSTQSSLRPQRVLKKAPCVANCPAGNDIRSWFGLIAQRQKLGISEEEALTRAWRVLAETNPFPAVLGRVCPHPCEKTCNREAKDGSVAINALERHIGDWGIEKKLGLTKLDEAPKPESIGVIGAGPAGLSFAYQLARRGYRVTVYEKAPEAGGMLYWGIPFYRLPADVLRAEVQRIVDLGVDLKLNTKVGQDISVDELKRKHKVLFLGVGADKGRLMKVPGEEGPGVWTGTDLLYRVNKREKLELGQKVAVIGGGDTAIDAARAARRVGADVTILYRRTRAEMPAIDSEIEDAIKEGIHLELLVAPVAIKREGDKVRAVVVQKMELGDPDESGRRRPVPVVGSEYDVAVDSIIAAISQEPDWRPLEGLKPASKWLEPDKSGKISEGVWAGGDVINLGLATIAVGQGRLAAEAVHAHLSGQEPEKKIELQIVAKERIKLDVYDAKPRTQQAHRPVEEWLTKPDEEISQGITRDQFLEEITRCFSCGQCYGCERCWMFCTPSCFTKVSPPSHGNYYAIKIETCDGCKKCADECPCGFLDMA